MKSTLMMLALLFSCFVCTATARADGFRSYISPSGSDNRQCTRSQPCRTFDGAMAKTDAGGEIIALETSVYDPVTITKPITLTALPGADVVIKANTGNAVTVSGVFSSQSTAIVVLRGLKIVGPGRDAGTSGVFVEEENSLMLFVENCLISNFGTGIHALSVDNLRLMVSDSVIRNNTVGLTILAQGVEPNGAAITRTRFETNSTGVVAAGAHTVAVQDCVAVGNSIGFLSTGRMAISDSMISRNTTGVRTEGSGIVTIGYSTVTGNEFGLVANGLIRSLGNNMIAGNDTDVGNNPNLVIIAAK